VAFQLIDQDNFNQDYRGPAEKCVYTFKVLLPDQFGASWTAQQMINAHITELQAQGSLLLEYKLFEDKLSGTFTTEYKVEMIASASPLWWSVIIIGVLALVSIIFISFAIQNVEDIVEYSPGAIVAPSVAIVAVAVLAGILLLSRRK